LSQAPKLTSQITVKINGQQLNRESFGKLAEARVDQHTHLPGMFSLRFFDPALKLLDEGTFDLTHSVEISAEGEGGKAVPLIQGVITALEPEFKAGMNAELTVRGYDSLYKLYRDTKSKTFLNVKDSDLAEEIATANGLRSEVTATKTVHDHIYQDNESDFSFLSKRAWRNGFECFVDEKKLIFRKPSTKSADSTLTWGQELLWFSLRETLAEQVKEVVVKGWDVERQVPIIGRASEGQLYPDVVKSADVTKWAQDVGAGRLVIVDQPVASQDEADILAAARLDEISGAFIEAEGVALRRPEIKAGKALKLRGLGKRFSGIYLVTSTTHLYAADGFKTRFAVRGVRSGLLSEQIDQRSAAQRWSGLVPAVVTNTEDPKNWARIKLKFPWMSEKEESDWARVIGIGAGPEAGFYAVPAVNDEVMVAFIHGDFSQPVVLGGVWNGKHAVPPDSKVNNPGERPEVRVWRSRAGHKIVLYDNAEQKLEIETKDGHHIILDDANNKVEIRSKGGLSITSETNMELTAKGTMTLIGKPIELNP